MFTARSLTYSTALFLLLLYTRHSHVSSLASSCFEASLVKFPLLHTGSRNFHLYSHSTKSKSLRHCKPSIAFFPSPLTSQPFKVLFPMLLSSKYLQTAIKPRAGCQESQLQFLAFAHSNAAGLCPSLCVARRKKFGAAWQMENPRYC